MKHRNSIIRILSLILAVGIVLASAIPAGGQRVFAANLLDGTARSAAESLVAHYKFDGNFTEVDGTVTGTQEGTTPPSIQTDSTRGQVMKSGSGNSWIRTDNPLYGEEALEGFTVGAWVKANAVNGWNGIWSISSGTGNADGFYGLSTNGNLFFNDNPGSATYQDMMEFGGTITTGSWVYIAVVMDGQKISMYKDGVLAKELTPSTSGVKPGQGTPYMLDFVSNWRYLYFGTASPHYWSSGDFYLDDLKVYDKALSSAEVLETYVSDRVVAAELVAADKEALTLPQQAIADLTLPTAGASGYTTVTWSSNNETVIANDGTVTRPNVETNVQMTATISLGEIQEEKIFTVTVPASDDSGDLVYYKDQLSLRAGYIASDLSLPTSIGTANISWGSSNGDVLTVAGNTAKVIRPAANTSVTLTATLTLGEASTSKAFSLVVLAQGASVVTYVSNDPALTTDGLKGQKGGMKIAAEAEDGSYMVLHKNQPILYTALGAKAYAAPALFRMADGKFGLVAADGGRNGNILLYTSDDLIDYTGERLVTLPGLSSIQKLSCVYDLTAQQYLLYAEDQSGTVHAYASVDLTSFTSTDASGFAFDRVEKVPSDAVWASELALTQAEYDKLTAKFTNPYSISATGTVEKTLTVAQNGDAIAALEAAVTDFEVTYSDGTKKTYAVRWNADDLANLDTSRPGVQYTVRGTIGGSSYYTEALEPLIEERADPCIAYDADNHCYYFTASYPVNGKDGADGYDRLVIRKADTIEGLATAEEYVIWDESENQGFGQFIWAPELHKIGDSWYFLSTAAQVENGYSFDLRPFLMECSNPDDITNPDSWGEPQRIKLNSGDTSGLGAMSLDMTYFEVNGKSYYAWADFTRNEDNPNGVSSIYLASVDPSDPTQLTSNCVVIAVPEYSWELVRYTVNEGPSVLQHNGKVYMAFSASGTGAEYCIGLLTADATADLLDPDSWVKTPYPIMTSGDFNDALCGPGHNSFTVNEAGDPVIVYHARPADLHAGHSGDPLYDACRYAYVKPVFFDSEGVPILNMSDEEFVKGGTSVEVTITVTGELQPTAHYDMSHSGNQLTDVSGKGNHATLYDTTDSDFFQYEGEDVLRMEGKQYATLPQGLITATDNNFTVEITMSVEGANSAQWAWVIGDGIGEWGDVNLGNYVFTSPKSNQGDHSGRPLTAIRVNNSTTWASNEVRSSVASKTWQDGYHTITVVSSGQTIFTYLDGEVISTLNHNFSIADVIPDGNVLGYIGKSLYRPDPLLTANILDMKVYDDALTAEQVKESMSDTSDTMAGLVLEDIKEAMLGTNPSLDAVTTDLSFPAQVGNAAVTWGTPSNTNVIAVDGSVTRVKNQDTTVTIDVSFTVNGISHTETLMVTVKGLIVEEELNAALGAITIPNQDDVRGNITLPDTSNGYPVTWTTNYPEIISVEAKPVAGYDDMPAGVVTRPETDTAVTVTATVTVEGEQKSKDIVLTVKAAPEPIDDEDYTDYFFTYFAGEGYSNGEQIYFAASQDGLNWTDLNENKPVLTSGLGEGGVRDPFIIRSPEGDKFYMIATDLKIYGNGDWTAAQTAGSQALMVWESNDLLNWSEQRMVTVSAGIEAGCTWAPEATYDPLTGEYVVYWASKVASDNYAKQRLYYVKTRDFYTFTEPQVYIDLNESSIDTTILYANGTYYRYTKNEGGNTNELGALTKTIFIQKSDSLLGKWTQIPSDSLNANQWVEGPTIFEFNQDDQENGAYCLLVDDFGGRGYYPLVTDDLDSGVFTTPDTTYKMPTRARHGTPIRITAEEYARVMETYNGAILHVVKYNLTNVSAESRPTTIGNGQSLSVTLAAAADYELPETITVTMGGVTLTEDSGYTYDKATGVVSLPNVTGDVVITVEGVKVEAPVTKYTVSFDANGGSGEMASVEVAENEQYMLPACTFTAPEGQQFKAWSVNGAEKAVGDTIQVNGNVTVTAIWEAKPVTKYTVSFAANGGSGEMTSVEVAENEQYTLPACTFTAPEGQQFKAWSVNGAEKAVGDTIQVNGNVTVTAIWEAKPATKYTVSFETNGGSTIADVEVEAGEKLIRPANPVKSGYTFGGWYRDANLTSPYDFQSAVTGDITLYAKWNRTGGSGTSTGNTVETIKNPDGSTTTTVLKPDGSKIETTKAPDGSSSVVTTSKNGQVEAVVTVSSNAVEKAEGAVALPMPELPLTTNKSEAPTVHVNMPVSTAVKVEIPVEHVTPGTVAILVKADGTEEIVMTSVVTKNGVVVELKDGETVKIMDNSREFHDVSASFWGADAVDFAVSRGIFNGTSATNFSPNADMNRAMIVTVLARMEGVDTTGGSNWYEAGRQWAMEQGISDGTNMMGSLTREQLAAMLYRYVGSPAISGTITGFQDTGSISSWAVDAMTWAVQNGIISGSSGKLNPGGNATRAEVATMLMRFIENNI